jgi:hypothetical protein
MDEVTKQEVKDFALAGLKLLKMPVTVFTDFNNTYPFNAAVEKVGPHFIMRINLLSICIDRENWKRVVAHELTHISQMYSGRLHTLNSYIFWCGKDWTNEAFAAHVLMSGCRVDTLYKQLPWEAEAFSKQDELAKSIEESMYVA